MVMIHTGLSDCVCSLCVWETAWTHAANIIATDHLLILEAMLFLF